jgi:hypothetical protein
MAKGISEAVNATLDQFDQINFAIMPKPVPGYQSIKLSNFKESGVNVGMQSPHSPTMKSLLQHPLPQGEYNSIFLKL